MTGVIPDLHPVDLTFYEDWRSDTLCKLNRSKKSIYCPGQKGGFVKCHVPLNT